MIFKVRTFKRKIKEDIDILKGCLLELENRESPKDYIDRLNDIYIHIYRMREAYR